MRHLLSFFFLLILMGSSLKTFAQNNNIGLNISMNDVSGLNAELRYEKMVAPRWLLGVGAASNFNFAHSFRFGFRYILFKTEKISLLTGFDYKLVSLGGGRYRTDNKTETHNSLELPLEFRYKISKNFSLNAGVTLPFSLDKGRYEEYFINSFRLGVIRSF